MSWPVACQKCLDAGVVELTQGNLVILAKCFCGQGKSQCWKLEMAPMQGFDERPLDWREYKSRGVANYDQALEWHRERIKLSELFWDEHKKQAQVEETA